MPRFSQVRLHLPKGFKDAVIARGSYYGDPAKRNVRIYGANETIADLHQIPVEDRFDAIELFCDYPAETVFGEDICRLCGIDPDLVVDEKSLDFVEARVNAAYQDVSSRMKSELRGESSPRSEQATQKITGDAFHIVKVLANYSTPKKSGTS
jgi:hypothetical protein